MILVGLGANLPGPYGAPDRTLAAAVSALREKGVSVRALSGLWVSAPVPVSDQPWYHNAVARVATDLSPHDLLRVLHMIESECGRIRTIRNEARILDLDLLAYGDEIFDGPDLVLPHPRLHERAFVLYPLREIAPDWKHPVSGLPVGRLIALLPGGQEIKREQADWAR